MVIQCACCTLMVILLKACLQHLHDFIICYEPITSIASSKLSVLDWKHKSDTPFSYSYFISRENFHHTKLLSQANNQEEVKPHVTYRELTCTHNVGTTAPPRIPGRT